MAKREDSAPKGDRHSGPATDADPMPPTDAVTAMDEAMKAMQRHEYARAAKAFQAMIDRFPGERALLDRARVFLEVCHRETTEPPPPETLEERVTAATAALNEDDDARAESLAKGVLADKPDHDIALYLLAAIQARRGRTDAALAYLRQAVEISKEAGAQARFDDDFESLRDNDNFRQLTDSLFDEGDDATRHD